LPSTVTAVVPITTVDGAVTDNYTFQLEGEGFEVSKTSEGLRVMSLPATNSEGNPQVKIAKISILPKITSDLEAPRQFTLIDFSFFNTTLTLNSEGKEAAFNLGVYAPNFNFGIARPVEVAGKTASFSTNESFSATVMSEFIVPELPESLNTFTFLIKQTVSLPAF